jgi:aerobic carbon-monoxide dehydrogenase medium subunit
MKAPAFDYVKPKSLAEVFRLLVDYGDEARLLAGGQTLLATLNMRLSEPALLIDLNAITALKGIAVIGDRLSIGALVTHTEIEGSALVTQHAPLLAKAVPHIAHRAIRNLGTWGGSIAYADPAAEWPTCLAALEGTVVAQGPRGERHIAAQDFFVDLYTTALASDEIVTRCEIPLADANGVYAFEELARRHGDYAIVGMALAATRVPLGIARMRLAFLGLGTTPIRVPRTEAVLEGHAITTERIDVAIQTLQGELTPLGDLTHAPATKLHLACVLARRTLCAALLT